MSIDLAPTALAPLPSPRGALTAELFELLRRPPVDDGARTGLLPPSLVGEADDDELHLALYCCYELHYRGFPDVDLGWEWSPALLATRACLERRFEDELRTLVPVPAAGPDDVADALWARARGGGGRSLSTWVDEHGTLDHAREMAVQRSVYQLKEADPHTWAIPRLGSAAKAVMVAIQADEYGNGDPSATHAQLFAATMVALGLDPTPNGYLDLVPGTALAGTNLISLFGLHRRWRGALVGHLALFEMTSTGPMSRYASALRRLGIGADGRRFYEVHVIADEVHQHLAVDGMVAGLLAEEPGLAGDVLFGAGALQAVEGRATDQVLDAWEAGRSSLRGA